MSVSGLFAATTPYVVSAGNTRRLIVRAIGRQCAACQENENQRNFG